MGNYFEPVLSEEQMAAYLDGMLSTEENNMVEEIIESSPEMMEIQDAMDSVDSAYIYETNEEIPIECMADDFSLPDVGFNYQIDDSSDSDNYIDDEEYDVNSEYQDESFEADYQDESLENGHEDSFINNEFEDISF